MHNEMISQVLSGLSILIAVVSPWIAVRLSLGRFRDEKLWEKKVHAYERIIEALHYLKVDTDTSFEAVVAHMDIPEEKKKVLRIASSNARSELERAFNIGSFILSEECQERLKIFLKAVARSSNAQDYFTHLDAYGAAIDSCLNDIIRIAKQDVRNHSVR